MYMHNYTLALVHPLKENINKILIYLFRTPKKIYDIISRTIFWFYKKSLIFQNGMNRCFQ